MSINYRIPHPNVITIYNIEKIGSDVCIVMEYLEGGNLAEKIKEGALEKRLAYSVFDSLLQALQEAHSAGIIHHDLKPENILFDRTGVPKLSDFGIARLLSKDGVSANPIRYAGTPAYMDPDLNDPGKKITPAADVYSIGLMFLECLTGERLNRNRELVDIIGKKKLDEIRPFLGTYIDSCELPDGVEDIIKGMLRLEGSPALFEAREVRSRLLPFFTVWTSEGAVMDSGDAGATNLMIVREVLDLFLSDGVIAPEERKELNKRVSALGVSQEDAAMLEEELRRAKGLPKVDD